MAENNYFEESEMDVTDENEILRDISQNVSIINETKNEMRTLFEQLDRKFCEMERKVSEIYDEIQVLEELKREKREEFDETNVTEDISILHEDTLSDNAKTLMLAANGPLEFHKFSEFLLDKAWNKPKPPILPIVRKYTCNIPELVKQLIVLKTELNSAHVQYKEQRRLDVNLTRRIDRLIGNVRKEHEKEAREGRQQSSIMQFLM